MLSRKKIAAVSGLLCGLAVTCAGATQAYAAAGPGACTVSASGDVTCVQRFAGKTSDGEDFIVRRANTCTPQTPTWSGLRTSLGVKGFRVKAV